MKKTKESIQIQVGAFLAIGVLLFMTAIFMLGSKSNLFQSQYELVCYFDDISGLRLGAPVQLAGVNVGFIEMIYFVDRKIEPQVLSDPFAAPADTGDQGQDSLQKRTIVKVKVTMKIDSKYQDRIRRDSIASVVTQGLLGDRMVYITPGSNTEKVLHNGDEIVNVKNPAGFSQLVERGDDLMIEARKLVKSTDELARDIDVVMKEIVHGDGLLHDLLYNPDNKKTLAVVNDILYNFDTTSKNLANITGKIDAGKGTLGSLVNDESLYQDLKTLMGKANRNKLVRSVIRYTLKTKEEGQEK